MLRIVSAVFALLLCIPATVAAQSTGAGAQARPIRLVVPFPPGSAGDVIARAIVPTATEVMKRTLIVDNRGGAAGAIAAEIVAARLNEGFVAALKTAEVKQRLAALGVSPAWSTPEQVHRAAEGGAGKVDESCGCDRREG